MRPDLRRRYVLKLAKDTNCLTSTFQIHIKLRRIDDVHKSCSAVISSLFDRTNGVFFPWNNNCISWSKNHTNLHMKLLNVFTWWTSGIDGSIETSICPHVWCSDSFTPVQVAPTPRVVYPNKFSFWKKALTPSVIRFRFNLILCFHQLFFQEKCFEKPLWHRWNWKKRKIKRQKKISLFLDDKFWLAITSE